MTKGDWAMLVVILIWEGALGETKIVQANSSVRLCYDGICGAWKIGRLALRFLRGVPLSPGGAVVSIENKTVRIAKPVYDMIKAVEELAADAVGGRSGELAGDLVSGVSAASATMKTAADDYKDDPAAVRLAVLLATDELAERLIAEINKRGTTPGK